MEKNILVSEKVVLNKVKLNYYGNGLFVPSAYDDTSDKKEYSCYVYLDKSNEQHMKYKDQIMKIINDFCKKNGVDSISDAAKFIVDGDKEILKINAKAKRENKPVPNTDLLKNSYRLKLKNKEMPRFISPSRELVNDPILLEKLFYKGCYIHVIFRINEYNFKGNGLTTALDTICFAAKGDKIEFYKSVHEHLEDEANFVIELDDFEIDEITASKQNENVVIENKLF